MNVKVSIGQIQNLSIKLHPGWFLFLGLVACLLAAGYLPAAYAGLDTAANWLLGGVVSLFVGGLVLAREAGRMLVVVRYRLPLRQIVIFPFGGVMQIGHKRLPLPVELRLAVAGFLSSMVLAGLLAGLWLLALGTINLWLILFSVSLALFNLLPVAPLDGGRMLLALVEHLTGDSAAATKVTFFTSWFLSIGLILSGGVTVLVSFFTDDFFLVLIEGLLLLITGWLLETADAIYSTPISRRQMQQLKDAVVAQMVSGSRATPVMVVPRQGSTSTRLRTPTNLTLRFSNSGQHKELNCWQQRALLDSPSLLSWVVHPQTGLLDALRQMDTTGTSSLLVVEDHRIVATLSREKVLDYIFSK